MCPCFLDCSLFLTVCNCVFKIHFLKYLFLVKCTCCIVTNSILSPDNINIIHFQIVIVYSIPYCHYSSYFTNSKFINYYLNLTLLTIFLLYSYFIYFISFSFLFVQLLFYFKFHVDVNFFFFFINSNLCIYIHSIFMFLSFVLYSIFIFVYALSVYISGLFYWHYC